MSAGQPYVILDNDDDDDDRNEYILGASIPIDLTESGKLVLLSPLDTFH